MDRETEAQRDQSLAQAALNTKLELLATAPAEPLWEPPSRGCREEPQRPWMKL
jgi:hypothetical protein